LAFRANQKGKRRAVLLPRQGRERTRLAEKMPRDRVSFEKGCGRKGDCRHWGGGRGFISWGKGKKMRFSKKKLGNLSREIKKGDLMTMHEKKIVSWLRKSAASGKEKKPEIGTGNMEGADMKKG